LDWIGLDWIESIGGFDKMEEDLLSPAPFVQFGGTVRIGGVSRTKKKYSSMFLAMSEIGLVFVMFVVVIHFHE
jgi:hypothetical protein